MQPMAASRAPSRAAHLRRPCIPSLSVPERGLRRRAVAAAAGAPDGEPGLVLVGPAGQQPGGVLRAAVGMEYGAAGGAAAPPGTLERPDDDARGHAPRDRPAGDHARAQAGRGGETKPPLPRPGVGDAADELSGGDRAREVALGQARPGRGALVGNGGPLLRAGGHAAYARPPHALAHAAGRGAGEPPGRSASTDPAPRVRPDSSQTRPAASLRSAHGPSGPPSAGRLQEPERDASGTRAVVVTG